MLTLLKQTVLEYACIVWSPADKKHIKMLEDVQRRFTSKFACFTTYDEVLGRLRCNVSYWDRLKELKIFSLQRRRERYMMIYIYKIFIGLCPNPGFERFPFNPRTGFKVEVKQNLRAEKWVQTLRNTSFFSLAPTLFNSLPLKLRSFTLPQVPTPVHVDKYKKKLDKYLWCIPDQPGNVQDESRFGDTNSILHQMEYYQGPEEETSEESESEGEL